MNADPLVTRYLGDGEPIDRSTSDGLLRRIMSHRDEHGFGLGAVEPHDGGRMIGFVGLSIPAPEPAACCACTSSTGR